ncbi:MAG: ChrR family anti-sigma-E factor [Hyphomicrobium sp.]
MSIKHHPDVSNLMSCAAGSQPESVAAVMAAHISMCHVCAGELRRMEEIGAALFEEVKPATLGRSAPIMEARAGEANGDTARTVSSAERNGDVPAALVPLLGHNLDDIPWKRLGPGLWHYPLPLSKNARGDLRLFKVAPGKALPDHGHGGTELTLTLRGSYHDRIGEFRKGDVADLDENIEHQPVADASEGCICLVASEGKAKFKSLLARLVQPLTGL